MTVEQQKLAASAVKLAFKLTLRSALHRIDSDLAEECAMRALVDAAAKFDPSRGYRFTTYAGRAVCNRLQRELSRMRDRRARRALAGYREVAFTEDRPPSTRDPEPEIEVRERQAAVIASVARLSQEEREVIEARFYRGETLDAMAKRYAVSPCCMGDRIRRILGRLRGEVQLEGFAFVR